MRTRFATLALVALAFGALVAGGQAAWAATTAAPPTLEVQVIGQGNVTGKGIDCGNGSGTCAAAYGSSFEAVTLTATPASGWALDHWEDISGNPICGGSTTCSVPNWTGDNTVTAVFRTSDAVGQTTLNVTVSQDSTTTPATPEGTVSDNSPNYSISCSATTDTCSQQFLTGSEITLRETPTAGYTFVGWGGGCAGHAVTCTVSMKYNHDVSANFVASGTNPLTITVDGSGTVTGRGIDCSAGSTCTVDEPTTSSVTLTATPADGYQFTGWSDDCLGTQPTCTVQMSDSHTVTATFDPIVTVPVLLTVNGAGTVSGDNGLSCGPGPSTCSGNAAPDSTIQFVASPPLGSTVTWLGCTSASGTFCNVVVGSNPIAVTATFSVGTGGTTGGGSFVQLTVSVTGDGYVTSTGAASIYCTAAAGAGCTVQVQQNSVISVHAVPASLSSADFSGWGGSCTTTATTCLLTMSTAKSVSATFNGDSTTYDLTASVNGSGTISGAGLNRCSTTGSAACTSPQAADANVTISATPNAGNAFTGWSGACSGTSPVCTVDMSQDQNVTATFAATAPTTDKLTLTVTGAGSIAGGTAPCTSKGKPETCTSTVKDGSPVTLKAEPAKGYVFKGWTGACAGTKPTCALTVNDNTAAGATFALALAPNAKPTVAKVRKGYRVTFKVTPAEAGKLTITGTRKGSKPVKVVKTVKAAATIVRITVRTRGRWVFTLSLRSASGVHALRYRKTI